MKIRIEEKDNIFKPIVIELTFETKEGLGLFCQLFNYAPITNMCDEFNQIWSGLDELSDAYSGTFFNKVAKALSKKRR